MRILGVEKTSFKAKDSGDTVSGMNLHLGSEIQPDKGSGLRVERVFLSDRVLKSLGFVPVEGMTVEVLYNKWGKVSSVRKVFDEDDI